MAQGGQPNSIANPGKVEEFSTDGNGRKRSLSVSPSVVSSVDTDVSTHRTSSLDILRMLNGDSINRAIFRKPFVFTKLEVCRWVGLVMFCWMNGICDM